MSQVPSLTPNFTDVALKIWAYRRQIDKIGIFGINFFPLRDFYKIWHAGATQRPAPSRQI